MRRYNLIIGEFVNDIENGFTAFLDLINESFQESARLARLSLGVDHRKLRYKKPYFRMQCWKRPRMPSNLQIDECQEKHIEQWAKVVRLWVDSTDDILRRGIGPMIAQGSEAKVYYRSGSPAVPKKVFSTIGLDKVSTIYPNVLH